MSHPPRALVVALVGALSAPFAAQAQPEVRDVWVIESGGSMVTDQGTYTARIAPDGSVSLHDAPNVQPDLWTLGATFDITDAVMRSRGEDPYASAKLGWLDKTRDVRVAHGTRYRADQLARSEALMRANIDGMWKRLPNDAARKQALFEMWDECAETGEPALVAAGEAARATLLAVAHERLGPNAFTPQELQAFNARRTSRDRFDPTGPRPRELVASR